MTACRLEIISVSGGYGAAKIVHDVSFVAEPSSISVLIGGNGAGKTTIMRIVTGLLPPEAGDIRLDGESIRGMRSSERVERGLVLVPEGRLVFPQMSVQENLRLGAYARRARAASRVTMDRVFAMFPRLAERRRQLAGTLSGGEQQMLAIGRGLMALPRVMLLDEPTLGLAPLAASHVFDTVTHLKSEGLTILMAEQDVARSLAMADRAYVVEHGRIVLSGDGASLANDPRVREAYIGYA
ncbi:MAG TPA: ABC transporter ATP-binding protein [Alphaproteobacteria bacterium]|nr:ABC transporter ATP-binding protein [Alphaproteobacteria bacterium]